VSRRKPGTREIPVIDLGLLKTDRAAFVQAVGAALEDIGFFALEGHGVSSAAIDGAYAEGQAFFARPLGEKLAFDATGNGGQRGYTPMCQEHAKDATQPDLKEFWQTGQRCSADHPLASVYPPNVWPDEMQPSFRPAVDGMYSSLEALAMQLLGCASEYLGQRTDWLPSMAQDGNTILRVLHYPPCKDAPAGAVRSAEHEDINLMTMLVSGTADGLQVKDHDGQWISVPGNKEQIIVDAGDMLQNVTNGLFKATTHRVINPAAGDADNSRYSMPLFAHPRPEVDLTPLPALVERTGGVAKYPSITAGEFLHKRLVEIGLIPADDK
jgi:isopenicillin N synthase-like dioxygenase